MPLLMSVNFGSNIRIGLMLDERQVLGEVKSFVNFQVSYLASKNLLHSHYFSNTPSEAKSQQDSDDPQNSYHSKKRDTKKGSKYQTYSYEFKKKAVREVVATVEKTGESLSKVIRLKAKKLNVHCKNLQRWYRRIEINKREGGRKAAFPEMEERLAAFIRENPNSKRRVIIKKAKQIMESLEMDGHNQFNYSKGWYQRFRQRFFKKKEQQSEQTEAFERSPEPKSESEPIFEPKNEDEVAKRLPIILIKKDDSTSLLANDCRWIRTPEQGSQHSDQ